MVAGGVACQSSSSDGMQVGCRQKPATGMPCASPHMRATPVSVKALMIRSTLGAVAACRAVCTRGCSIVYYDTSCYSLGASCYGLGASGYS